jgi:hypothetical protein
VAESILNRTVGFPTTDFRVANRSIMEWATSVLRMTAGATLEDTVPLMAATAGSMEISTAEGITDLLLVPQL